MIRGLNLLNRNVLALGLLFAVALFMALTQGPSVDFYAATYFDHLHDAEKVPPGTFKDSSFYVFPNELHVTNEDDPGISFDFSGTDAKFPGLITEGSALIVSDDANINGIANFGSVLVDGTTYVDELVVNGMPPLNCGLVQMDCGDVTSGTFGCADSSPNAICKFLYGQTFYAASVSCDQINTPGEDLDNPGGGTSCGEKPIPATYVRFDPYKFISTYEPGILAILPPYHPFASNFPKVEIPVDEDPPDKCVKRSFNDNIGVYCAGITDYDDDILLSCCSSSKYPSEYRRIIYDSYGE